MERDDLPSGVASDLILQIRERATAGLLSAGVPEGDAERLARQLNTNGRLTASLILSTSARARTSLSCQCSTVRA